MIGKADILRRLPAAPPSGRLTARVRGALWWDRDRGSEQIDRARRAPPGGRARRPAGSARRSVKIMQDGVAENFTAAHARARTLDGCGWRDRTTTSGLNFVDPGKLRRLRDRARRAGFQVHFHALGDRAVREALDAVEAARARQRPAATATTWRTCRWCTPTTCRASRQLGATANIQPLWAAHEPQMDELTIPFLGERRAAWQYPFGDLLRAPAPRLAAGSDWPVSSADPLARHPRRRQPGRARAAPRPSRSTPTQAADAGRRRSPRTPRAPPG